MDKDFIKRGIVLPLVCAAVLCLVGVLIISGNAKALIPLDDGAVISYYDKSDLPSEMSDISSVNSFEELESGSLVGTIGDIPLRYDADYSVMSTEAVIMKGSALPSQNGCMYIKTISPFSGSFYVNSFTLKTSTGTAEYTFYDEADGLSEQKALSIAPAVKKSIVVYFQVSDGNGLSSEYKAYVFEEAE